jgi:hypothetical protein
MERPGSLIERSFEGEALFYPWGLLGRGYLIADLRTRPPFRQLRRACQALLFVL